MSRARTRREAWQRGIRMVSVRVDVAAVAVAQIAGYAEQLDVAPSDVVREALTLWLVRQQQRDLRDRRLRVLELCEAAQTWEPISDFLAAEWSAAVDEAPAASSGEPGLPIDDACRRIAKSPGPRMRARGRVNVTLGGPRG